LARRPFREIAAELIFSTAGRSGAFLDLSDPEAEELEMEMLKRVLVLMLAAGFIVAGGPRAAVAQEPAKQHALSTTSARTQLRHEIARTTKLRLKEIEVHTTNAMIQVVLVNSPYNAERASDREYLASTILALMKNSTANDPGFKPIVVIHVDFVRRGQWFTQTVDTIEFRREAGGAFARHQR
jgi:hypothetical protein